MRKIYKTSDYPLDCTGHHLVTEQLQELIDKTSAEKGILYIERGTYLVSSLFLKNDMELVLEEGATLLATTDERMYPVLLTRVAGIEMPWYVGVLNCINVERVTISGKGKIDGNGPYWWNKYWGMDGKGGMRKEYDRQGLRWACDYDCKRIRNVVIQNSSHIELKDFTSYQSGFWNIHILYACHILVDGVHIDCKDKNGPSTDGIDIDSSAFVEVKNCVLACNDDSICIKSGRDEDGRRVGRPSYEISIHDCQVLSGFGVTIGSEVSGGIYQCSIYNMTYHGTDCGFRIKSAYSRGGYIRDIEVSHLKLENVKYLFHFFLDWNPQYNLCQIPSDYTGEVPSHWKVLTKETTECEKTKVENIKVHDITSNYTENYEGINRAFHLVGYADMPMKHIQFMNMKILSKEYGIIKYVEDIDFEQCQIQYSYKHCEEYDAYDNR